MENNQNKNFQLIGVLGSLMSIIGLLVAFGSIGINSFYLKGNKEECDISKINDLDILLDYANKENIHSLMEAVKYESEADYIYCNNYNKIFNKEKDLLEAKNKYKEAKEEYESLKQRNKELEKDIRTLNVRIEEQIKILELEISDQKRPEKGAIYKKIKEQNQLYKTELDSLNSIYLKKEEFYNKSLAKIDSKIEKIE